MERADAEGFVEDFNRAYEEKTELRDVCGHRFYGEVEKGGEGDEREKEDDELSYFQIGRRTTLPVSLVEEGRYAYVSDAVVGALCEGEKGFLARHLSAAAADGDLPTVTSEPSRTVEAALEYVEDPDHVLLPRNEVYDEVVEGWEAEGRVRRFGDSRYLRVDEGGDKEGDEDATGGIDCWIHTYDTQASADEPGDAFVLDDGGVTLVQKKGRDTRPPGFEYVAEYEDLNDDLPLTVYFGDKGRESKREDEFFDVVYRVVVSEPLVEGGVCRVRRK